MEDKGFQQLSIRFWSKPGKISVFLCVSIYW